MGFFTLELARRVGAKGRVLAIDVQPKMLEGLKKRAAKIGLADRIEARLCEGDGLGIEDYTGRIDFALAFAMVHEVRNPAVLFKAMRSVLKPDAKLLFAEPAGHVGIQAFEASLALAREAGFVIKTGPPIRRSHSAVLSCR